MARYPHRPHHIGVSLPQAYLRRTPSRQSSQNTPSRHLGEALSTVPHQPKPGHISQTINARGFAYATCCTVQPLVATRCRGEGFRKVYCCPTAAKPSIILPGAFLFLQDLQEKKESRRADSNR
jgi:hypothetical protein